MFSKKFTNNAKRAITLDLIAAVNHEGIVTRILASTVTAGVDDAERAEAMRMFTWAKTTFVGQPYVVFQAHNGIVPSPGLHVPHVMPGSPRLEDLNLSDEDREKIARTFGMPYEQIAEYFNVPYKSVRSNPRFYQTSGDVDFLKVDGMRFVVLDDIDPHAIAEAMLTAPGILDLLRVDLLDIEARTGKKEVNVELRVDTSNIIGDMEKMLEALNSPPKWARGGFTSSVDQRVYSKKYSEGPAFSINSYWQSRTEPTKFYRVIGMQECLGHWHIDMHCLQNGGTEDRVWMSTKQWADIFTAADRETALAPLSPQSSVGPYPYQLDAVDFLRPEKVRTEYPNPEKKLFRPELLEARDATAPVIAATQQVLDGVAFHGTEAPPKEGEQYQRIDSGRQWVVIDATRDDMETWIVTMEAQEHPEFGESYRIKSKFRSHAQWLAKWRPLDSEGNVKPVVFIDIENDDGAVVQEVREDMLTHNEGENAVRWIRVIGRELDRRVPGWRDYDPPGVLYDDCALIIRAIRTLFRGGVQVEAELLKSKDQVKAQLQMAEHHHKKMTGMERRVRHIEDLHRGVVADAARMFRDIHGRAALVEEMKGSKITSLNDAEPGVASNFVRRLRERSGELMP
ncbi:hypothetical protein [Clavibacter phage 33]|nr:hypothetical protein [Clavibacter phage 33]